MKRAYLNGFALEYEECGAGEPVIFIHGCFLADSFAPLCAQSCLSQRYRLINYHRRGFMGSTGITTGYGVEQQAAECLSLLDHLGIESPHVVSHSYGCLIALQLALLQPAVVTSLVFLEPAFPPALLPSSADGSIIETRFKAHKKYAAGDVAEAIDLSLELALGPEYREAIQKNLPANAFDAAVADADTYFQIEERAALNWNFTQYDAARIRQPILSVLGDESHPRFRQAHESVLMAWMPQTEVAVIPQATHLLHMMNPEGVAGALVAFFARHPVSATRGFEEGAGRSDSGLRVG